MPEGNRLLEALAAEDRAAIQPLLAEVRLAKGHMLFEAGEPPTYCYFPKGSAAASYFVLINDDDVVEALMIGREGCIGGLVNRGQLPAFARGMVVQSGTFARITCADLARLMNASPTIEKLMRDYADCLVSAMLQSIACNVYHNIEQRAARWLCAMEARSHGSLLLDTTQEQLAARMGSGRSYASRVLQRFKRDGLLRTYRGGIEITDYAGLRARSCNCIDLLRTQFLAVMPERPSAADER